MPTLRFASGWHNIRCSTYRYTMTSIPISRVQYCPSLPSRHNLLFYLCAVSCLIFLPLLVVGGIYSDFEGSRYQQFVSTSEFSYSIGCTLALCFPLAVDLFLDLISYNTSEFLGFRIMNVASITITGIAALSAQHSPYGPSVTITFMTWSYFVDLCVVSCLLHHLVPRYFTRLGTLAVTLVLLANSVFYMLNCIHPISGVAMSALVYLTLYGSTILFMGQFMFWVADLYKSFKASKSISFFRWYRELSISEQCAMTLILSVGSCLSAIVVYVHAFGDNTHANNSALASSLVGEFARCVISVFTYIIPSRAFREKLLKSDAELKVKTEFVRYISHEMRTPVGTLIMSLSSLEDDLNNRLPNSDYVPIELVRAQVHEMKTIGEGALGILDDLLLYEKIERHGLIMNFELCPPDAAIVKALELWRSHIDVVVPDPSKFDGYCVKVDVNRLKLVFNALLATAAKRHSEGTAGKIAIRLDRVEINTTGQSQRGGVLQNLAPTATRISPTTKVPHLRLAIRDNSPDRHTVPLLPANMFEREARGDGNISSFGLWIAKNLIEMHGASTNLFQREPTDGSEYHIDIPMFVAGPKDPSDENQGNMVLSKVDSNLVLALMKNMPTEDSVPLEKLSVLIVDDSAMVRRVTGNLVSDLGHTFTAVADGEKAVQLVASGAQYDVILMDNQMPVMTGVDATRIIRDTHGYKGIILGVTGNTLEEDIMEFKHAGANKVIMKPLLKESFQNGVLSERKAATKPSALPL